MVLRSWCCNRGAVFVMCSWWCARAVFVVVFLCCARGDVRVLCSWCCACGDVSWCCARGAVSWRCARGVLVAGGVLVGLCACCARGAALVVLYVCCARARSWCVSPVFVVFSWWCDRDGVRVLFSW